MFVELALSVFTVLPESNSVHWMTYPSTRGEGLGCHLTCIVEKLVAFTVMLRGGAKGPEGKQKHRVQQQQQQQQQQGQQDQINDLFTSTFATLGMRSFVSLNMEWPA